MQIKLDELLRATQGCHNAVMDIENLSEEELDNMSGIMPCSQQRRLKTCEKESPMSAPPT